MHFSLLVFGEKINKTKFVLNFITKLIDGKSLISNKKLRIYHYNAIDRFKKVSIGRGIPKATDRVIYIRSGTLIYTRIISLSIASNSSRNLRRAHHVCVYESALAVCVSRGESKVRVATSHGGSGAASVLCFLCAAHKVAYKAKRPLYDGVRLCERASGFHYLKASQHCHKHRVHF